MQLITESNNFIFIRDDLKAGSRKFALLFFFLSSLNTFISFHLFVFLVTHIT